MIEMLGGARWWEDRAAAWIAPAAAWLARDAHATRPRWAIAMALGLAVAALAGAAWLEGA